VKSGYGISEAARLYGKLPKKNWVEFITVDRDENVYLLNKTKDVSRLDTGEYQTAFGMRKYTGKATDMKFGPDGSIYMSQLNNPMLYKIDPTGGDTKKVANFTVNINGFDFDANGIAYGGAAKTGLSALQPDLTARTVGDYGDVSIILSGVRVYRNYVYVADDDTLWKSPITGTDGSVGPKEMVFRMKQTREYAGSKILSFALGEDGTLYVATDHADAVFLVYPNGGVEPLYKGIMMPNSGLLAWGFGHYLYLNMKLDPATNDLMRIDTGMNEAPK
jgi:glucose/arabinose dehydrogenase